MGQNRSDIRYVLLAAGYSIEYVRVMGRWSSNCWQQYVRLNISAAQNRAKAMQTATRERAPFFFDSLVDGAADLLRPRGA